MCGTVLGCALMSLNTFKHTGRHIEIKATFSSDFGTLTLTTTPTAEGKAEGLTETSGMALRLTRDEARELALALIEFLDS